MLFFQIYGEMQSPMFTETRPIWVLQGKKVLWHSLCYLYVSRVAYLAHTPQLTCPLDPLDFSPSQLPSAGSLCTDMLYLVNKSFGETARASCHIPSAMGQLCCTSARPIPSGSLPTALLFKLGFPALLHELFTRQFIAEV